MKPFLLYMPDDLRDFAMREAARLNTSEAGAIRHWLRIAMEQSTKAGRYQVPERTPVKVQTRG